MARITAKNPLDWSVEIELDSGRKAVIKPALGKDCLQYEIINADESLSPFQKDLAIFSQKIDSEEPIFDWFLDELEELFNFCSENFRFLSYENYIRAVYLISKERIDSSLEYWDNQPIDKLLFCLDVANKVQKESNPKNKKRRPIPK